MRLRAFALIASAAQLAAAQSQDTTQRAPGATVSGVVRDSIARAPLAGAIVQIVAADTLTRFGRSALSDSLGRYTLGVVPEGRYTLGFFHPIHDSLGLEPLLREVRVDSRRAVQADLATPSPSRIRDAICGERPLTEAAAVVVGVVRDARSRAPVSGVTVTGEWLELSLNRRHVARQVPHLAVTTADNGWFAMCDVPSGGTISLLAARGADSTDRIDVLVPVEGFLRREFYLGPAEHVAPDTMLPIASRRHLHAGDGRLSGTVVTATGAPLPGAIVGIVDGPLTRANERGEWTLAGAPLGTRLLDVRAVGYYPERRAVDVVAGAPPHRVALSTLKAVLDTIKVKARYTDPDRNGFETRRRTAMGRFITPQDIASQQPIVTTDLFRMLPGLRVLPDSAAQDRRIVVRGNMQEWCAPAIYIDGNFMSSLTADDIDLWVHPHELVGVEIYTGAGTPIQFQQGRAGLNPADDKSGCGAIVFWTKVNVVTPSKP